MMTGGLVVIGFVLLATGLLNANQATLGVFIGVAACFFGILARLAQAAEHAKRQAATRTSTEARE